MSAVIMLAIVGMWGAVLGPMWLRRHDAMLETRSVDRFSTAMRVLSRRPAPVGSRALVLPSSVVARATGPSVTVSGRAGDRLTTASPPAAPRASSVAGGGGGQRVSAATYRRRRVLALLLATSVVTLLPAALMSGPWLVANLVIDLLLVGDIAQLRVTARRAAEVRAVLDRRALVARNAARAASEQPVPRPRRSAPEAFAEAASARRAPARGTRPAAGYVAPHEVFAEQFPVRHQAHAMAGRVTSPVASSPNSQRQAHPDPEMAQRIIDLTVPGAWREAAQADVVDRVVATAMSVDDSAELNDLLDRRRVV